MKFKNIALSLTAVTLLTMTTAKADETTTQATTNPKTGWQKINDHYYYVKEDGTKATSTWIDHSYVDKEGKKVVGAFVYDENYKSYFYLKEDGNYAEKQWLEVNGKWYYFKEWGYMAKSEWKGKYYLNSNGSMANQEWIYDGNYSSYFYAKKGGEYAEKEWVQDSGKWYYLKTGGYLATRQWVGDYFVNGDGAMMSKEWLFDPKYNATFYLKADGSYARSEWLQSEGNWYYFKANGARAEKEWVGGYYLGNSGVMATGKLTIGDTKYTFSNTGEVEKQEHINWGWIQKNGQRYFFNRRQEQVGDSNAKKVIDVSEHNGTIQNWSQVIRDNGIDGVIVRLGYYAYAEDKQLAHNIKELNRLGIPYGVYLYTYAENETDAELEAKHTIELMKKYNIQPTYPIYYDVENWEYVNKKKSAPKDTATWVKIVNKYMDAMHQAGYSNVRIYSYRHLLQTRLNHPDILKYVDWVAAYTDALDWDNPHYSGPKGWQYTSSEYLKGMNGRVDVSVWY